MPFEAFLEHLRAQGYLIGVDTHLRFQTLLQNLDPNLPQEKLKTSLAPLFAHNQVQQDHFYRIFNAWFGKYEGILTEEENESKERLEIEENQAIHSGKPISLKSPIYKENKKKLSRWKSTPRKNKTYILLILLFGSILFYWAMKASHCYTSPGEAKTGPEQAQACLCDFFSWFPADQDGDGWYDELGDNCEKFNPQQLDTDGDGTGDKCEDQDHDGIDDEVDNCPSTPNPNQLDRDQDSLGDLCDPDDDNDGIPDSLDACPLIVNLRFVPGEGNVEVGCEDQDGDQIADQADNCPEFLNPEQMDRDQDGIGDDCDSDRDGDGIQNEKDPCPNDSLNLCEEVVFQPIPLDKPKFLPVDISNLEGSSNTFLTVLAALLGMIFLLLPFGLVAYELLRYAKRRKRKQAYQPGKGPESWPMEIEFPEKELFGNPIFYNAARLLRRRQVSSSIQIDVPASVKATIENAGFPDLQFQHASQPSDYLVLIDKRSKNDHLAAYYRALCHQLQQQDIHLEIFYYQTDPRIVRRGDGQAPIRLEELLLRFYGYRLLIFGDGERMLNPINGEPARWMQTLEEWPVRALMSPKQPAEWSNREFNLSKFFLLLPATLKGIVDLGDFLGSSERPDFGGQKRQDKEATISKKELSNLGSLQKYLGEHAFSWLCACAIYQNLNWGLTLRLGEILSPDHGNLIEEELLKLIRLPWFRSHNMPRLLRHELLLWLKTNRPNLEKAVRKEVIRQLEENAPKKETPAYGNYMVILAMQRYEFDPEAKNAKQNLQNAIDVYGQKMIKRDHKNLLRDARKAKRTAEFEFKKENKKVKTGNGLPSVLKDGLSWETPKGFWKSLGKKALIAVGPWLLCAVALVILIPGFGPTIYIGEKAYSYENENQQYRINRAEIQYLFNDDYEGIALAKDKIKEWAENGSLDISDSLLADAHSLFLQTRQNALGEPYLSIDPSSFFSEDFLEDDPDLIYYRDSVNIFALVLIGDEWKYEVSLSDFNLSSYMLRQAGQVFYNMGFVYEEAADFLSQASFADPENGELHFENGLANIYHGLNVLAGERAFQGPSQTSNLAEFPEEIYDGINLLDLALDKNYFPEGERKEKVLALLEKLAKTIPNESEPILNLIGRISGNQTEAKLDVGAFYPSNQKDFAQILLEAAIGIGYGSDTVLRTYPPNWWKGKGLDSTQAYILYVQEKHKEDAQKLLNFLKLDYEFDASLKQMNLANQQEDYLTILLPLGDDNQDEGDASLKAILNRLKGDYSLEKKQEPERWVPNGTLSLSNSGNKWQIKTKNEVIRNPVFSLENNGDLLISWSRSKGNSEDMKLLFSTKKGTKPGLNLELKALGTPIRGYKTKAIGQHWKTATLPTELLTNWFEEYGPLAQNSNSYLGKPVLQIGSGQVRIWLGENANSSLKYIGKTYSITRTERSAYEEVDIYALSIRAGDQTGKVYIKKQSNRNWRVKTSFEIDLSGKEKSSFVAFGSESSIVLEAYQAKKEYLATRSPYNIPEGIFNAGEAGYFIFKNDHFSHIGNTLKVKEIEVEQVFKIGSKEGDLKIIFSNSEFPSIYLTEDWTAYQDPKKGLYMSISSFSPTTSDNNPNEIYPLKFFRAKRISQNASLPDEVADSWAYLDALGSVAGDGAAAQKELEKSANEAYLAKNYKESSKLYIELIKYFPASQNEYLYYLAVGSSKSGNWDQAKSWSLLYFEGEGQDDDKHYWEMRLSLAISQMKTGEEDKGRKALESIVGNQKGNFAPEEIKSVARKFLFDFDN